MINRSKRNKLFILAEGFLQHAAKPEVVEALAQIKVESSALERGKGLLENWKNQRSAIEVATLRSRKMTLKKRDLRDQINLITRKVRNITRAGFYNDPQVLSALGMTTQRKSVPVETQASVDPNQDQVPADGPNETPAPATELRAVRPLAEEKNQVVRWRGMLNGIKGLEATKRQIFLDFGYTDEYLTEAEDLVNQYAWIIGEAETMRKGRVLQTRRLNDAERQLLTWVYCIRGVMKTSVAHLDAANHPLILAMADHL